MAEQTTPFGLYLTIRVTAASFLYSNRRNPHIEYVPHGRVFAPTMRAGRSPLTASHEQSPFPLFHEQTWKDIHFPPPIRSRKDCRVSQPRGLRWTDTNTALPQGSIYLTTADLPFSAGPRTRRRSQRWAPKTVILEPCPL